MDEGGTISSSAQACPPEANGRFGMQSVLVRLWGSNT